MSLREAIRARALAAGFDAVRFTEAKVPGSATAAYSAFIAGGRHGDMEWLAREPERRATPAGMWPAARSAIVCALSYAPDGDPLAALDRPTAGSISVYARNRDYHDVMKPRLKQVARWLAETEGVAVKVFVDTAPLLEKPLAQRSGLGWQGKHTNLVSREHGSWLLLGEILTDLALPPDEPESDHCGSCTACLGACPTDAFPTPYTLDARRCISYLTIEHKGPIPHEFRTAIGNRIYGCDDCLAACPWNKFAETAREAKLRARPDLEAPAIDALLRLDDASFRTHFSGSPIKRIGRDRFIRNCLIAAGNGGSAALVPVVEALLDDPAPLVRGAAVWALARLAPGGYLQGLASERPDADVDVRAEWTLAVMDR